MYLRGLHQFIQIDEAIGNNILLAARLLTSSDSYDLTRYIELIHELAVIGEIQPVLDVFRTLETNTVFVQYRELADEYIEGTPELKRQYSNTVFRLMTLLLFRKGYSFDLNNEYVIAVTSNGTESTISYYNPTLNKMVSLASHTFDLIDVLADVQKRVEWIEMGNTVESYLVEEV